VGEVALDFGTCNSVLAVFNESLGRAETVEIPGISSRMTYRLAPGQPEQEVWVVPSVIHYSETETLIGDQVISRGLAEHPDTMRWMKRSISQGATKRKKTAQGHKSPEQAGQDFLRLLLNYASNRISFESDSFTFTVPVEAFETFQNWLWKEVTEPLGIQRVRLLDEPTACIFGYHGVARQDERFVVFDFGGGTLDVSAVRIDYAPGQLRKAVQLGRAGADLGGMDIDQWLRDDFHARHNLNGREDLEALVLREVEKAKIALSDPGNDEAEVTIADTGARVSRVYQTAYRRVCPECERGRAGRHGSAGEGCLGCLLAQHGFAAQVAETLDRAVENAAVKAGMRKGDITRVLVTGGTSLVPVVRKHLTETFRERVVFDHPFDSVARGACRGVVEPVLQHDYAVESYNKDLKRFEFKPLFGIGTEYPTKKDGGIRRWGKGSCEGQTKIGLKIFEVSQMKRRALDTSIVDESGRLQAASRVSTEQQYICLNPENPTFIVADPPINMERDKQRFLCEFGIDGNRTLLVTVVDHLTGKGLLREHPVVRL
jgi:molecular chaperone DnaK